MNRLLRSLAIACAIIAMAVLIIPMWTDGAIAYRYVVAFMIIISCGYGIGLIAERAA